jgi:plastocyanin domain-containing protein
VTSCTSKIIIPSLNITKSISSGQNVINFTPTASSGEIPFSCWMGMVRGKFVISE